MKITERAVLKLGKKLEKVNLPYIRNSNGKRDAILTLGIVAFIVCLLGTFLGLVQTIELFGKTFTFQPIPAGNIAALLTPTLGAYVWKRGQDKKAAKPENPEPGSE